MFGRPAIYKYLEVNQYARVNRATFSCMLISQPELPFTKVGDLVRNTLQ